MSFGIGTLYWELIKIKGIEEHLFGHGQFLARLMFYLLINVTSLPLYHPLISLIHVLIAMCKNLTYFVAENGSMV
jgi:hypothetical protein